MNVERTHLHATDPRDDLFQEISAGIEEWVGQEDRAGSRYVEHSMRGHLRRYLRRTPYRSFANAIELSNHTSNCNLVINDQIGIKIIQDLTTGSKKWIHKQILSLVQKYDYLILYGHQISEKHLDTWNQIKRSATRQVSGDQRIAVFATITRSRITIPLTDLSVAKKSLARVSVYVGFFAFLLVSGHFFEIAGREGVMGSTYVGSMLIFNLVLVLLGVFLVRYL